MIPSTSRLSALLLSTDIPAAATSARMLESFGFSVSKTDSAALARELCRGKRFDLGVYDQETDGASEAALFGSPYVVLGLVGPNNANRVLGKRIHFVVQKPFTNDLFVKTLKAAYSVIALGRRRSFRHEVCISATSCNLVHRSDSRALKNATIVNVSQKGMCLQTAEMLPQEATVQVSFPLSADGIEIKARGTVVWAHASGRAGIKVRALNPEGQPHYDAWLASMAPNYDDLFPRLERASRLS
ncbi:MAG TPA: PilZ domain-containing protein [Candidatus Angelobacter sp.]|nr:PilZ domain-containing protein [Candidatus Angelobacter sp.]